jgi:heat shock protein HtpX
MLNIYEQVDSNKRKSTVIILVFVAVIALITYFLSQAFGYDNSLTVLAVMVAMATSLGSYYYSDKIILTLSQARSATREKDFLFYTVTENLCLGYELPLPKLYIIEDSSMNAFATGRDPDHAVVVATRGLLDHLDRTELEGVIAHELSHIKNYDIRVMALVTVLVGVITLLADWVLRASYFGGRRRSERENQGSAVFLVFGIILALLSPLIANLMKLAISRSREYLADASGVKLTKYPEGLARALEKLAQDKEPLEVANKATAHLYIANPLKNHHDAIGWFAGLFNTHPPIEERIKLLRNMS